MPTCIHATACKIRLQQLHQGISCTCTKKVTGSTATEYYIHTFALAKLNMERTNVMKAIIGPDAPGAD